MACEICGNTGYHLVDVGTYTIPDYIEVACRCNPAPTDAEAVDWEPDGTAWEDFHSFDDARFAGI